MTWFRTDWQQGGALTAFATYQNDDGRSRQPVVVKLPVPPVEVLWLRRLQDSNQPVVPRLLAWGQNLGGYDMVWVVLEQLAYGPLGPAWNGNEFDLIVDAAGRFYQATSDFPTIDPPQSQNWSQTLDDARRHVREQNMPDAQRWARTLKMAQRKIKLWADIWQNRSTHEWCHGDLHLGNAMTRVAPPKGPALLFDLALVHTGHWVEDAIYFEHLYWGRDAQLQGRHIARMLAHQRKTMGLPVEPDWSRLAQTRRALLTLTAPRLVARDSSVHGAAALEILEAAVH